MKPPRNRSQTHKVQRKTVNHLLNFHLPEREKVELSPRRLRRKPVTARSREEFLQANFRFVVLPFDQSYFPEMYDPDIMVEWDRIEQVILHPSGNSIEYACPICLDRPQVPKITRCGHIYCWSCILRYLSYSEHSWKRCPMCFDSVNREQLRSVQMKEDHVIPGISSFSTFQLLRRYPGDISPHLVERVKISKDTEDATESCANKTVHDRKKKKLPLVTDEEAKYSRISIATVSFLNTWIDLERKELEKLVIEAKQEYGDSEALPFLHEAISACDGKKKRMQEVSLDKSSTSSHPLTHEEVLDPYLFYQIQNGQNIFLHPVNVRCLTTEFGLDATQLPLEIHARVMDVDQITLTSESRKRFRFLQNLPLYSQIIFCEVDLNHILSNETKKVLSSELTKRKKQRKLKRQLEMDSKLGNEEAPSPPLPETFLFLSSETLFPSFEESCSIDTMKRSPDSNSCHTSARDNVQEIPSSNMLMDEDKSFATITKNQGYFPKLSESPYSQEMGQSELPSGNAWSQNIQSSTDVLLWGKNSFNKTSSKDMKAKSKKGGKFKTLFSNTSSRSYQ